MSKEVKEIIYDYMKESGFTVLWDREEGCACKIDHKDGFPGCGTLRDDCITAYHQPCPCGSYIVTEDPKLKGVAVKECKCVEV